MLRPLLAALALTSVAHADHDHGAHVGHETEPSLTASLSVTAAKYEHRDFLGDYQGVTPAMRYARGRFAVGANAPFYRLTKNGLTHAGPADVVVDGQVHLAGGHPASAGLSLAVSLPTGSQNDGLGMGHVMVMPHAWGMYMTDRVTFVGSFGYGRALGSDAHGHHDSGGAIVDPMNLQELTWTAQADLLLARGLAAGPRASGGVPIGDGVHRVVGGVRVTWTEGRVTTSAEVQAGFAGDPFDVRGILATALRL